ncbi:hypothetical protein [Candidatus Scalindua japonica]|nr:hypothetical protein [Candidatus Scalindua japonica]
MKDVKDKDKDKDKVIKNLEEKVYDEIIKNKNSSSLITVGNVSNWDALLFEMKVGTKTSTTKLITSKLKPDQLEKFKTIDVNQLTDQMKEDIVAAYNAITDNLTFYKEEVAGKGIILSSELQMELNNLKEVLDKSGELKKEECNLSVSQKEEIRRFNVSILMELFPKFFSYSKINEFRIPRIEKKFIKFIDENVENLDNKDKDNVVKYSKMALNDMWAYLCKEMEDYQTDIIKIVNGRGNQKIDEKRCKDIIKIRDSILHKKYLLIKEVLERKITGIKWRWSLLNILKFSYFKYKPDIYYD